MIQHSVTERTVPSWFKQGLFDIDPRLIVYFNPLRNRWVIDRCTRGGEFASDAHEHTPECPKSNVTIVQDEQGYMPLCQQVLDDLKAKDAWQQHGSFENFHRSVENQFAEAESKRSNAENALYKEASADNKRQLNEAYTIYQNHDLARPHKHG